MKTNRRGFLQAAGATVAVSTVTEAPPAAARLSSGDLCFMKSAYWITTTFRPAASVPAGFTADGLPVGIQIVGRYRDDLGMLQMACAFERATGFGRKRPAVAQG
jgi:Asp-tRNA(Asn)/Glu-tRNA(Gln) amidotransferase A subunit family amidase